MNPENPLTMPQDIRAKALPSPPSSYRLERNVADEPEDADWDFNELAMDGPCAPHRPEHQNHIIS